MDNYEFPLSDFNLSAEDMQSYQQAYPSAEGPHVQTGDAEEPTAPVAQGPIDASSAGSISATTTQSTGAKRTRASTSTVWNDFDKKIKTDNDGTEVRYAVCKICGNELTAKSSGGTGHLQRHAASCKKRQGIQMRQTQLQYNPDGSVRTWEYNPEVARESLCRLIASQDLPLNFGESDAFQKYIRAAHNPRFSTVSRQTTTRDLIRYYNNCRDKLKEMFHTCTFSIALTSDIWSGRAREDYISVVAHYVNDDWIMEKRIIGFKLINVSHNAENIAESIIKVVEDFGLTDKIFSITLDNAAANTKAMEILTPLFNTYAQSFLLHQRCACHIINLIVKSGLKRLNACIDSFRDAISFINCSNQRIAAYKSFCVAMNVRPRKFGLDMPVRWNSTYLMLKHILPYKSTLSVFLHTQSHQSRSSSSRTQVRDPELTEDDWVVGEKIFSFLEIFHKATVCLSGIYYPTSPMIVHNIVEIATHLKAFENDPILRDAVVAMKSKFLKYWREIPILYAFAFILDPRAKLQGFINVLQVLSEATDLDYCSYFTLVKDKLYEVYNKYENKFGSVRLERPPVVPNTSRGAMQWGKIFGSSSSSRAGAGAGTQQLGGGRRQSTGDLSSYLNSDSVSFEQELNILSWWQTQKVSYPVLSILARDVLTVPVSTVSSESAFSLSGRIIEERRTSLSNEMVEVLMTVKDWEQAESRLQHTADNKDLEESFENLYLDSNE